MIMEQQNPSMEVLEVCKISPSQSPPSDFCLPLTLFDLMFFLSPPTERILFYSPSNHHLLPFDSFLQILKHSLSLTLSHFLPLAGNLVWPNHSPHPFILYKPGDSVSLTVAKTDADFNHLSSNQLKIANQSHFLVPYLPKSQSMAPAMSLQITLFPNSGFSIGITTNHVVADGRTSTLFLKSWASISKTNNNNHRPTPVFDRTAATNDPINGLQSLYNKYFETFISNPKSRLTSLTSKVVLSDDVVSGTFELKRADLDNLRRKVNEVSSSIRHLTTFVLTFAYVSTCLVKSQRIEGGSKIALSFLVDWRPRVETLGGVNYFGNGVSGYAVIFEGREFEEENAMATVAKKISEGITEITEVVNEKRLVEMLEENAMRWRNEMPIDKTIVVGGSPRFGVYEIDFGWGSCKKVEMVSINPSGSFSMAESRNGNGGVEVGIALPENVMNVFSSLFFDGVK
ncbi:phenolic glucoside malonyltransferase 1-like [Benincasa hispida]|uniref:phenolic glucoside malonyltransferase 1-like n=1 Tax=Benincasa hispida TaxID=102211 RepID=UPI001901A9FF|nr:phenolic glucoside malonyltransferase 1-like [Benincasa hispida]